MGIVHHAFLWQFHPEFRDDLPLPEDEAVVPNSDCTTSTMLPVTTDHTEIPTTLTLLDKEMDLDSYVDSNLKSSAELGQDSSSQVLDPDSEIDSDLVVNSDSNSLVVSDSVVDSYS